MDKKLTDRLIKKSIEVHTLRNRLAMAVNYYLINTKQYDILYTEETNKNIDKAVDRVIENNKELLIKDL